MKKLSLFFAAAVAIVMMMFSSCLEKDNGIKNGTDVLAIVKPLSGGITGARYGLYLDDYTLPIYAPSLFTQVTYTPAYVLADWEVDTQSEENADADEKGYYTGSVYVKDTYDSTLAFPTTTQGLDLENALTNEIIPDGLSILHFLDNTYFMGYGFTTGKEGDSYSYYFYYDEEPQEQLSNTYHVYNLYTRVVKNTEGSGSTISNRYYPHAINVQSFLSRVYEQEEAKDYYCINLKYVKEIDKDTNEVTWSNVYNEPLRFPVYKQK